jgi:hypothetical protein
LPEIDVGGILFEDGVKKKERHEGVIDNVRVYSQKSVSVIAIITLRRSPNVGLYNKYE